MHTHTHTYICIYVIHSGPSFTATTFGTENNVVDQKFIVFSRLSPRKNPTYTFFQQTDEAETTVYPKAKIKS